MKKPFDFEVNLFDDSNCPSTNNPMVMPLPILDTKLKVS